MTVYITKKGSLRLQAELTELRTKQRPKIVAEVADAAAQGDRSENAEYIYGKKKLREIDRRMHFLIKRMEDFMIVDPQERSGESRVFFGATVKLEDENGEQFSYQLVGEDELDLKNGKISFKSPLGIALMKKQAGDTFVFRRPMGEIEMTILSVDYT